MNPRNKKRLITYECLLLVGFLLVGLVVVYKTQSLIRGGAVVVALFVFIQPFMFMSCVIEKYIEKKEGNK